MALLALQGPVARDLRQVVTGVHLVADLSRMGGLVQHVAESVRRRHPEHVASGEAEELLSRMGQVAAELAGLSPNGFCARMIPNWPPRSVDATMSSTICIDGCSP